MHRSRVPILAQVELGAKPAKLFPKWRAESSAARTALGMPRDARPWTGKPGVQLRGIPGKDRELDLIDVAYAARRASMPSGSSTSEVAKSFLSTFPKESAGGLGSRIRTQLVRIRPCTAFSTTPCYPAVRICACSGGRINFAARICFQIAI